MERLLPLETISISGKLDLNYLLFYHGPRYASWKMMGSGTNIILPTNAL